MVLIQGFSLDKKPYLDHRELKGEKVYIVGPPFINLSFIITMFLLLLLILEDTGA